MSLQAFGTDGERALSNAFNEEFPVADHHRCFIHLRKNIEMKLSSIGINGRYQNEFLDDIFGHNAAAISYHGIVDSDDSDDFYANCARWRMFGMLENRKSHTKLPHFTTGLSKMLLTRSTHRC